MSQTNGKIELQTPPDDLTTKTMLEVLIEAVRQLSEEVEALKELNVEILEKVNNLSSEGDGFGYDN